ncbi:MAG: hypothetical protein JWN11_2287 [Hyphomicrobiales bacterium]|nr:hypothetical protein [Hyphomicrobiales bacterium]
MKYFWRLLLVVIVIAALAAAWWWYAAPKAAAVPQTIAVARGDVEQTVLASGALQANSVVSVGAEVSGRIETLHVKLGDVVKKGDPIAEIDSLDQANAVKAAQAALANIKAQKLEQQATVIQTQQALTRAKQMNDKSLVTQATLEAAQAALDAANAKIQSIDAQISQATLAVDSANLNLSRTKIIAPSDGTVVAVLVVQGQSVNAAQTSPTIVKLADLDTMVISAQISEADVTKVKPGQRVYFTILGEPDNKISATLRSIEPAPSAIATADTGLSSTDNAVYYNGLFEVPNRDHKLRIAMTTQVSIVLNEVKGGLVVPSSSLRGGRNGNYVVAVYDPKTGATQPARVKIGINNNVLASVDGGLNEGDLVVVAGTGNAGGPGFGLLGQNGQNGQNGGNRAGGFGGARPGGGALRGLGGAGGGAPLGL